MTFVQRIETNPNNPFPLGRHIEVDERSLDYATRALPLTAIKPTKWNRYIPVLDQQDLLAQGINAPGGVDALSSCTGNAGAGLLGTLPFFTKVSAADRAQWLTPAGAEEYAIGIYEQATQLDEFPDTFPPTDSGSSGLGVAKALQARGLISSYEHAFDLNAVVTALQSGPVLLGTNWYEAMFDVGADGMVTIDGNIAGGHEYVADAVYPSMNIIRCCNSWGNKWGDEGYFFLTYAQVNRLLAEQGDCVVPKL